MLPPKLVLSPLDFSTNSDEALKVAADLAKNFGSEICLVHVVPSIPRLPASVSIFKEGDYEQELHKEAEARLAQIAAGLSAKGFAVTTEVGTANEAAMEILRIAEHRQADLIVIATHGMTGWHKLALGSVTEKIVRLAEIPVLVLRAHPQESATESAHSQSSAAAD